MLWLKTGDLCDLYAGEIEPPIRSKGKKPTKGIFLIPGYPLASAPPKLEKPRDQKVLFQNLWDDKLKEYEVLLHRRRKVHLKTLNLMEHIHRAGLHIDLDTNLIH